MDNPPEEPTLEEAPSPRRLDWLRARFDWHAHPVLVFATFGACFWAMVQGLGFVGHASATEQVVTPMLWKQIERMAVQAVGGRDDKVRALHGVAWPEACTGYADWSDRLATKDCAAQLNQATIYPASLRNLIRDSYRLGITYGEVATELRSQTPRQPRQIELWTGLAGGGALLPWTDRGGILRRAELPMRTGPGDAATAVRGPDLEKIVRRVLHDMGSRSAAVDEVPHRIEVMAYERFSELVRKGLHIFVVFLAFLFIAFRLQQATNRFARLGWGFAMTLLAISALAPGALEALDYQGASEALAGRAADGDPLSAPFVVLAQLMALVSRTVLGILDPANIETYLTMGLMVLLVRSRGMGAALGVTYGLLLVPRWFAGGSLGFFPFEFEAIRVSLTLSTVTWVVQAMAALLAVLLLRAAWGVLAAPVVRRIADPRVLPVSEPGPSGEMDTDEADRLEPEEDPSDSDGVPVGPALGDDEKNGSPPGEESAG